MTRVIQAACLCFALVACSTATAAMQVVFINPGFSEADNPTGGFWNAVSAFMSATADDLDIDLEILYSDRNHIKMIQLAESVAKRNTPPDYLIVVNEKSAADQMVKIADEAGINVFVMLNRFEGEQREAMGEPRGRYPHWIGSLIPDNRLAGQEIARLLIDKALASGAVAPDGHLHLLGLSGDHITQASVERVEGLQAAVAMYPDVELLQVIPSNWSREEATRITEAALHRYPDIGAIWAANDPIAIGAMAGAQSVGKKPGDDIFFGGLNWDPPGLEKVKSGEMVTSVGGHFMTGGWALILLYDYHNGRDFAEHGSELQYTIFGALDKSNIDLFLERFGDRNWGDIDFTAFSKVLNPALQDYPFGVEAILQQ